MRADRVRHTALIGRLLFSLGLFFLVMPLAAPCATQDFGVVKGTVRNVHTGEPLPYANVILVGTLRGAAAGRDGAYRIDDLPSGEYNLQASYVGFDPVTRTFVMKPGGEVVVDFDLRENFFQTREIVVTATRSCKLMEDVPVVTEIITRGEIEEKGAETLSDILEDRPGISTAAATSGEQFVYINGVDSKRILVLVDNVPVAGKLYDRIPLNRIDSDRIEHVEIVKGPGSAVYGSEAMGGVINIFTRRYTAEPTLHVTGRTGSNDLYSGNLALSGSGLGLDYLLSVDHLREGSSKTAGEIDITETRSTGGHGKVRLENAAIGRLELAGEYKRDRQGSESFFMGSESVNESRVHHLNSNAVWERSLVDWFEAMIAGYYSDNLRTYETAREGAPASIETITEDLLGVKSDFTLFAYRRATLDFGVDFSSNDYENDRLGEKKNRRQVGVFVQLESDPVDDLTVVAGGRYDWITELDEHFSPRVSAMYRIGNRLKLRGSWGTGFRAPSFIELYSDFPIPIPGMPLRVVGNLDLEPEESKGLNVGAEYLLGDLLLLNATLFRNKFEGMIVDYQPAPLTFSYLNVESVTFRGVELQTRWYLCSNLTATVSYNYTDVDQDEGNIAISTISPHTALARISYGMLRNRLRFSLRDQFFSRRDILVVAGHAGDLVTESKEAYNSVDLTVSYDVAAVATLRLGANNLFDYIDENYGPYLGRRLFLAIETAVGGRGSAR